MSRQDLPVTRQHAPEVVEALRTLARLALRAGRGTPDRLDGVAVALLEALVAACEGQRGALVLVAQEGDAPRPGGTSGPPDGYVADGIVRTLAVHQMREDEVRALVASALRSDAGDREARGEPVWLAYALPIAEHLAVHEHPARSAGRDTWPTHALLLLGWEAGPKAGAAAAQARTHLPLLADAATAVLVNALLAESGRGLAATRERREGLLREMEQARTDWEQTFDAVSDPICVVTADYRIVRANAAYVQLFGLRPGQFEAQACFAATRSLQGPCEGCPLPRTVATGQPSSMRQERLLPTGPQGALERHVFQVWTYPVVTGDGTVDRVVEIHKEVTEQERLSQMTSQAEALREADRLKAELLGTVSHELRSPLAAIKGYAATLLRHERRLPRAERHEFLQAIGEASDRLEVIIDRLLLMSQLETGAVGLHRVPVDVARLARDAADTAERRVAPMAPGQFTFALRLEDADGRPAGALPLVAADPRWVREVLDNLLENAVKYSPEGGLIEVALRPAPRAAAPGAAPLPRSGAPRVADALAAAEGERPMLEIRVRDSGLGIPREQLGRIFDRFHRVDTRLTREGDGLGLGLAICRRLVQLHHGAIWAQSAPGQGSTFHVLLPLDGDDEIHLSSAESAAQREEQ